MTHIRPLLGRESALAELAAAMAEPESITTLTGPPGIGKTHTASAAMQAWRGESLWVDLTHATDKQSILTTLASALGLVQQRIAIDPITDALATLREPLLALDNAEGCVEALEALLDDLTATARILITSRVCTNHVDEVEVVLQPLPPAAGIALFTERAAAVHRSAEPANPEALAKLVERLDGIPLAIELAAARVRLFTVPELLERMSLDLLKDRRRKGRHASLRTALESSWELLSPSARNALARATVFAGGCDRSAWSVVIEPVGDPMEALDELIEASLVRIQDSRMYLLAGIHEFALERLTPEQRADSEKRHAEWFCGLGQRMCDQLPGSSMRTATETLRKEALNLGAVVKRQPSLALAAEAAIALGDLALLAGGLDAHVERVQALGDLTDLAPMPRAMLLQGYARALQIRRESAAALQQLELALSLVEGLDAPDLQARLIRDRGSILLAAYDPDQAVHAFTEALALARTRATEASILLRRGEARLQQHELPAALADLEHCRTRTEPDHAPRVRVLAHIYIGVVRMSLGHDLDVCANVLGAGIALARQLGDGRLEGSALLQVGSARLDQCRLEEAHALFSEASSILHRNGDSATGTIATLLESVVSVEQGDFEAAQQCLSVVRRSKRNDAATAAQALMISGVIHHTRGELDSALPAYRKGLTKLRTIGIHEYLLSYAPFCVAALCSEHPDEARDLLVELQSLHDGSDDRHGLLLELATHALERKPLNPDLEERATRWSGTRLMTRLLDAPALPRVASDGSWFEIGSTRVDLSRRRVVGRVLAALLAADSMTVADMLAAGWPGQKPTKKSGTARVHVAVSTLRKLGLKDALRTTTINDQVTYTLRAHSVEL